MYHAPEGNHGPGFIIFAALVLLGIGLLLGGCSQPKCMRSEVQPVVVYPNIGLIGLGNNYLPIALMPVITHQEVCVEYEKEDKRG